MCHREASQGVYVSACTREVCRFECTMHESVTVPEAKEGHLTCTAQCSVEQRLAMVHGKPSTSSLPRTTKCLSREKK